MQLDIITVSTLDALGSSKKSNIIKVKVYTSNMVYNYDIEGGTLTLSEAKEYYFGEVPIKKS